MAGNIKQIAVRRKEEFDPEQFWEEILQDTAKAVRKFFVPIILCLMAAWPFLPAFEDVWGETLLRGFDLAKCGPYGVLFLILPLLLAAVFYSSLSGSAKTVSTLVIFALHAISTYGTYSTVQSHFAGLKMGGAYISTFFLLFPLLFVLESLAVYLSLTVLCKKK